MSEQSPLRSPTMPRRWAPAGYVYHIFNRAVPGVLLFERPEDYFAFERILEEACERIPMRILAYCLMPNHWHLVLQPYKDGDLAKFMHWLTTTHAHRWRQARNNTGRGHVYQGPYKSIPVETSLYLVILFRYVERNALTANLVERAEDWRWCSLWRRLHPHVVDGVPPLSLWPGGRPEQWTDFVNESQTEKEIAALKVALARGQPFGSSVWREETSKALGLQSTLRQRGRPRKGKKDPGSFFVSCSLGSTG